MNYQRHLTMKDVGEYFQSHQQYYNIIGCFLRET